MSLVRRTVKNSGYSVIEYAWPIVLALVASPYIVRTLGTDRYGLLSIVGITLGFFGFLDLGIGAAATRQIAALHQRSDHVGIGTVVSTAAAFYLGIGIIGGALVLALTSTFVGRLLDIPADLTRAATLSFYIAAAAFPVSLVTGAFGAVPRALQRFDISTKLSLVFSTLGTASTVAILLLGYGVPGILLAGLMLNAVALPVSYSIARRLLPSLRVRLHLDRAVLKELFSFGGYFLLSTLAALLLYQLDKLLIGAFLGVGAVTYYVVPGNLAQRIQGFTAASVAVVFPVSAALFESGARESLIRLYHEGSRLVFILIVALAVPLNVFAHKFLLYWMGADIADHSTTPMLLLVWTYALLSTTGIAWGIANGAGRAKINAFFTLGIFIVNIALFLVLIRPYGVSGAAAAYLVSAAVGAPALVWTIERRVLGLSGAVFLAIFWRVGLVGIIQAAVAFALLLLAGNLWLVLLLMAVSFISFFPIYWTIGFAQEGDKALVSMLVQRFGGINTRRG